MTKKELAAKRDQELNEACRNRYPCGDCGARGVPLYPRGDVMRCEACDAKFVAQSVAS